MKHDTRALPGGTQGSADSSGPLDGRTDEPPLAREVALGTLRTAPMARRLARREVRAVADGAAPVCRTACLPPARRADRVGRIGLEPRIATSWQPAGR